MHTQRRLARTYTHTTNRPDTGRESTADPESLSNVPAGALTACHWCVSA